MFQKANVSKVTTLNYAEKYWGWKMGIRVVICLLNIIGIGAVGALITGRTFYDTFYSFDSDDGDIPGWAAGSMTTFCVSFAWCLIAVLVPLLLKPVRPLHPGIAVGLDLMFWGGFLTIGFFTLFAVLDVDAFGSSGYIGDYSLGYGRNYSGGYRQASNGTWVYYVSWIYGGDWNETTHTWNWPNNMTLSDVVRSCPDFGSCQQQDDLVNELWHEKPTRFASIVLVNATQWLNLLLHLALFIWACVDTARRNRRTNNRKQQQMAEEIIADLEKRGIISVKEANLTSALDDIYTEKKR